MQIKLSDHFTYSKLLRFTLPSIIMMIFTSIYSVVDGLFVSNLVGENALSAVNIVFPVSMILAAAGFMLGSGGSAVVARTMGEGRPEDANRYFSMIILVALGLGTIFSVGGTLLIEPIARLAGSSDLLMDDCVAYGRILLGGSAVFMLQVAFQVFFVTAPRPVPPPGQARVPARDPPRRGRAESPAALLPPGPGPAFWQSWRRRRRGRSAPPSPGSCR